MEWNENKLDFGLFFNEIRGKSGKGVDLQMHRGPVVASIAYTWFQDSGLSKDFWTKFRDRDKNECVVALPNGSSKSEGNPNDGITTLDSLIIYQCDLFLSVRYY